MSAPPKHPAHKGCYVVIGQHDQTDFLVGHYISLSQAKKAARNKARMAGADPSTRSDVFCLYDDAGECHARITFDELPDRLRHPNARLEMPESLPPPKRYYDREFILFLLALLAIPLLWWAKGFYDDMELGEQDKVEYAQMRQRFTMDRPIHYPRSCDAMTWNYYEVINSYYEDERQMPPPRPKADYLRDKLRYYDESDFDGPEEYGLLKDYVQQELAHVRPGETVGPDALHEKNRRQYLSVMEKTLPMREELGRFVIDWRSPEKLVVTNWDYRQLKRALALCEQIVSERPIPSLAFLLDNGNGKSVLLDGYEADVFRKMIAETVAGHDVQKANRLYQALISYQVIHWNVYYDDVQSSITRYSRFLDEQKLNKPDQVKAQEAHLLKLNPHEFSQEYKDYRERTLGFLRTTLAVPAASPSVDKHVGK